MKRYAPFLVFLLALLYRFGLSVQGIDNIDAGFCQTYYQNFFSEPELLTYYHLYYLTGLAGGLWEQWLGAWGLLGFRLLECVAAVGAVAFMYAAFLPWTGRRTGLAAAALCLLCAAAAADGTGSGYPGYGYTVNLMQNSARPYHWEVQDRQGQPMTWGVDNAFDGYWGTLMEHVCWNNESLDDIPEVTFYFKGNAIKDIWIRNGLPSDNANYRNYARLYKAVADGITYYFIDNEFYFNGDKPYGTYVFNKVPDQCDPSLKTQDMYDGYQRLSLPTRIENVTKVEFYIKGWYPGEGARQTQYWMQISDVAFLPDTLTRLYGTWIFDPANSNSYNYSKADNYNS